VGPYRATLCGIPVPGEVVMPENTLLNRQDGEQHTVTGKQRYRRWQYRQATSLRNPPP